MQKNLIKLADKNNDGKADRKELMDFMEALSMDAMAKMMDQKDGNDKQRSEL